MYEGCKKAIFLQQRSIKKRWISFTLQFSILPGIDISKNFSFPFCVYLHFSNLKLSCHMGSIKQMDWDHLSAFFCAWIIVHSRLGDAFSKTFFNFQRGPGLMFPPTSTANCTKVQPGCPAQCPPPPSTTICPLAQASAEDFLRKRSNIIKLKKISKDRPVLQDTHCTGISLNKMLELRRH